MTRSELVNTLSLRFPKMKPEDIDQVVAEILDGIMGRLAEGGRVEIRGFGAWALRQRPAQLSRNPRTGEAVPVPTRYFVHYRPGKAMKACLAIDDEFAGA